MRPEQSSGSAGELKQACGPIVVKAESSQQQTHKSNLAETSSNMKSRARRRVVSKTIRGRPLARFSVLIAAVMSVIVYCLSSCCFKASIVVCESVTGDTGGPVRITVQPNDLIAIEGESAELNCDAEGEPEPTIEWFHNGQPIKSSTNTRTTLGGSIQFLDVRPNTPGLEGQQQQQSDAGVYHCLARNQHGQARSRNATLKVACKYKFRQFQSRSI